MFPRRVRRPRRPQDLARKRSAPAKPKAAKPKSGPAARRSPESLLPRRQRDHREPEDDLREPPDCEENPLKDGERLELLLGRPLKENESFTLEEWKELEDLARDMTDEHWAAMRLIRDYERHQGLSPPRPRRLAP